MTTLKKFILLVVWVPLYILFGMYILHFFNDGGLKDVLAALDVLVLFILFCNYIGWMMNDEDASYMEKKLIEANTPDTKRDKFIMNTFLFCLLIPVIFILGFGIFYLFGTILLIFNIAYRMIFIWQGTLAILVALAMLVAGFLLDRSSKLEA